MKKLFITFILICVATTVTHAQYTAVRVNALALATGTLNAGVDVAMTEKLSLDISAMWSPTIHNATYLSTGVRRWRFEPNVGWFYGGHGAVARYKKDDKIAFIGGVGTSIGYSWILSSRWNFSLEGGIGLFYVHDKWLVPDTSYLEDIIIRHRNRIIAAPSKAEVSFSYLF